MLLIVAPSDIGLVCVQENLLMHMALLLGFFVADGV